MKTPLDDVEHTKGQRMTKNNTTTIAPRQSTVLDEYREEYGARLDVIRQTIAKGTSDTELALFLEVAKRTGLDPFAKQIYAVMRKDRGVEKMTIQTGIDGYRTIAQRTGCYDGQRGPFWCGADGVWRDVWLSDEHPIAAKVEVLRRDFREPIVGVAVWREYCPNFDSSMWRKFPSVMLAKCAEALALRRAFPQELSGVYTSEEMEQSADVNEAASVRRLRETLAAQGGAPTPTVKSLRERDKVSGKDDDVIDAEATPIETPETIAAPHGQERDVDAASPPPSRPSLKQSCVDLITEIDNAKTADEVDNALRGWIDGHGAGTRAERGARAYAAFVQSEIEGTMIDAGLIHAATQFRDALIPPPPPTEGEEPPIDGA